MLWIHFWVLFSYVLLKTKAQDPEAGKASQMPSAYRVINLGSLIGGFRLWFFLLPLLPFASGAVLYVIRPLLVLHTEGLRSFKRALEVINEKALWKIGRSRHPSRQGLNLFHSCSIPGVQHGTVQKGTLLVLSYHVVTDHDWFKRQPRTTPALKIR